MEQNSSTPREKYDDTLEDSLPVSEKKGIFLFILGTIFSMIVVAGVVVLGMFYFKAPKNQSLENTPTPSQTEEKTILKNEEITFEILNASGVAGTATKYKEVLEGRGYKVNSVGIADEKQKGISVFMVKKLESQKEALLAEIKKDFPNVNYAGELNDSVSMVKLVVGN